MGWLKDFWLVNWPMVIRRVLLILVLGAVACAVAVVLGAVFGLAGRLSGWLGPKQPFPFGPFLAVGGLLSWLACDALWALLINPGPMGF